MTNRWVTGVAPSQDAAACPSAEVDCSLSGQLRALARNDLLKNAPLARELLNRAADELVSAESVASQIVSDVAELPDRNSPEDWPEAMLVTSDELRFIVLRAMGAP